MSVAEKSTMEMEQRLKDITECSICLDTFREPKILPCIHTFCLTCLKEAGDKNNRCPEDVMPCPICRKEFTIPEEGFSGLQKNFFMNRLVEIRSLSNPSVARVLCDLCSEDSDPDGANEMPSADMYCVDCRQKLCQECCKHHRRNKLSKCHKIIPLQGQIFKEDSIESALPAFCDQHHEKPLDIYCSVCQEVICAICFIEFHKTHDGFHINNIVNDFREEIQKNTENFSEYVSNLMERRKAVEENMAAFMRNTEDIETEINSTREELKQLVDRHSESLLLQLKLLKQEQLKNSKIQENETETLLTSLESYGAYCKQITTMGSASDICRAVSSLNKRADELRHKYTTVEQTELQLKAISLRRTAILNSDAENIVGKIEGILNSDDENIIGNPEGILNSDDERVTGQLEAENNLWIPVEVLRPTDSDSMPELLKSTTCQDFRDSYEVCVETEDPNAEESSCRAVNKQLVQQVKELQQQLESMKQREMERERSEKSLKSYKPTPDIVKKISKTMTSTGCVTVTGLTILDSELYIATRNSNDIEVYESTTYAFKRLWRLPVLSDPWDICSCSRNKCLYIASGYNCNEDMRFQVQSDSRLQVKSDSRSQVKSEYRILKKCEDDNGKIFKVNLIGNLQISWCTGTNYGTLSITGEGNIIFTVPVQSTIVEYDTNGKCLHEISISTDYNLKILALSEKTYRRYVIRPSHAEKLPNGNFVVTYFVFEDFDDIRPPMWRRSSSPVAGLCMINEEGQMTNIFSGKHGSGFGELCEPWYLAVDKNMAVLVLERSNKRISLLKPNLEYKRKLVSKKHGLINPYRMCLDESNGKLLVANSDSSNEQVLVYTISETWKSLRHDYCY